MAALGPWSLAQSPLAENSWFKVSVEKRGVYKISYDDFRKMGFDPAAIDPRKIAVFGNGGGMLPQDNDTPRPASLQETSIIVEGESDGSFDKDDYILFYAEGPDGVRYDVQRHIFAYESNLYSKKNYYFITVYAKGSSETPARIVASENVAGNFPVVQQVEDFVYHELDDYNELQSGRQWYGERFDLTAQYVFKFNLPGILENTPAKLVSKVMAQCYDPKGSSFKVLVNNTTVGEQPLAYIVNSPYAIKGTERSDTLAVSASGSTTQEITFQYTKGTGRSVGFLDFFLFQFSRKPGAYDDQTFFVAPTSLDQSTSQYRLAGGTNTHRVWNITDPQHVQQQTVSIQQNGAVFSTSSETLKSYVIFNSNVPAPALVGAVANQNIKPGSVDYIIVSHPSFLGEAQRLAAHRQQHNGWAVQVVTTEEVYNEFSSGRTDVSAIRDFLRYKYETGSSRLKSALFFGRGSYDYKDRQTNNTNFVPAYESRNSLSPLETYSSDDFYALLEPGEGGWSEWPAHAETLDIGVGRLPAKTLDEAHTLVDKIIAYDTDKKNFGAWRKSILFVADDGSISDGFSGEHQKQARSLADGIETNEAEFDTKRVFLGTYTKTVKPNGEAIPEVNDAIMKQFDRGALIINYTGHGSEKLWTDEKVLTDLDIITLENKHYPFLVTATCEFGRQDDPADISSAEISVLRPNGGSIGLVTTSRPVSSSTNFELNQVFYANLFKRENQRLLSLGEVFRRTKNGSTVGVNNRNFSLIGDPGMTLAIPQNNIVIESLETASGTDTLKALSNVTLIGHVENGEGVMTNFNGTLEATVFDKPATAVTIGKNNPAVSFKQWSNVLFRGKASVKAGAFRIQFVVPKNIAYEVGAGKLSFYAADTSLQQDAASAMAVPVGASEKGVVPDNTAPDIALFMGDTTFMNGGMVLPSTSLVARLHDASGLNTSSYGIGNTMIGVLDNDAQTFVLNDYYQADTDDYSRGWINFPLNNLAPGRHSITVKVWDTHNNPAQSTITFIVTDGKLLVIESLGNAPNPFQHESRLFFTHNRSGDDLEAQLYIYNLAGEKISAYSFSIPTSPYEVNLLEINGPNDEGKKLVAGVYLARLTVRSVTNGSKSERVTKLIVVN
nr:type IX secretion system sortase PorU [Chryseolinea lacunae]